MTDLIPVGTITVEGEQPEQFCISRNELKAELKADIERDEEFMRDVCSLSNSQFAELMSNYTGRSCDEAGRDVCSLSNSQFVELMSNFTGLSCDEVGRAFDALIFENSLRHSRERNLMDRLEFKAAITVDDTGTLTGLAWPFGTVDLSGDVIEKGAFTSPAKLPMLFAHDQGQAIGVWDSITEGTDGLTVKGRLLVNEVQRAREVHALIKEQAVNGLSIGFVTRKAAPRRGGGRTITALDLHEISVVAVPMNPGSRITSAKAAGQKGSAMADENTNEQEAPALEAKALEAMEAKMTARLDKLEAKLNRPAIIATKDNEGPSLERKAFREFLRTGSIGNSGATDIEGKALVTGTPASAGYLAPPEYAAEIIKLLVQYSPIRQYANVRPITTSQLLIPRRVNSLTVATVAETAAITPSTPTFEQLTFAPIKNAAAVEVSNEMIQDDAYNLEGYLSGEFAEQHAKFEGTGFVNGTSGLVGLLAAGAITNEVKTGVAADLPATDVAISDKIMDVFHAIPTTHAQNAVWVMNRTLLARLRKVKDTTGNYLLVPNLAGGPAWTIMGRPVIEAPDMPGVGAGANVIVFGDLKGFMIVDRVGLGVIRDTMSLSLNWMTRFIGVVRVGSGVTHPDRFVRLKCST